MAIISYDDLIEQHTVLAEEPEILRSNYKAVVKSHLELQCRNEKLRTRNARLIKIITTIRGAINGS